MKYILEYEEWQEAELNEMITSFEYIALWFVLSFVFYGILEGWNILVDFLNKHDRQHINLIQKKYLTKQDRKEVKKIVETDPQCKSLKIELEYYIKQINKIIKEDDIKSFEEFKIALKHNKELRKLYAKFGKLNNKLAKRIDEFVDDDELKQKLDKMRKEFNDTII